jgi:ADP-heptose:LPS heptosyltransferase
VLFFPDSLAPNRVWPHLYWNELGALLEAAGLKWLALPIRDFDKYRCVADARPMVRAAACMSLAGLAVGNDSGLMNWTPLVDLPSLCLLGPTRPELFAHAPLIRCLTPRTNLPYNASPDHGAGDDCNGCCYHFKHNPFCSQTCMSLANLLPPEVAAAAIAYHREHWG